LWSAYPSGDSIKIDGGNHKIGLKDTDDRNVTSLDGEDASIVLGDIDRAGTLSVRDNEGRDVIRLGGNDALITAGGNGHAGKVLLQNADRNSIALQ
jgi:hypothetical protein